MSVLLIPLDLLLLLHLPDSRFPSTRLTRYHPHHHGLSDD